MYGLDEVWKVYIRWCRYHTFISLMMLFNLYIASTEHTLTAHFYWLLSKNFSVERFFIIAIEWIENKGIGWKKCWVMKIKELFVLIKMNVWSTIGFARLKGWLIVFQIDQSVKCLILCKLACFMDDKCCGIQTENRGFRYVHAVFSEGFETLYYPLDVILRKQKWADFLSFYF